MGATDATGARDLVAHLTIRGIAFPGRETVPRATCDGDSFLDGIEDSDIGDSMGMANLHVRDWFTPFRSDG